MQGMFSNINKQAETEHTALIETEKTEILKDETSEYVKGVRENEEELKGNIRENTRELVDKFVDKKKEEAWEKFVMVSLGHVEELTEDENRVYSDFAEKYGKGNIGKGKKELEGKAGKYLKEKVAIANNKKYTQEKKERKLRELKEDTINGIKGYDDYVAGMAFANKSEFREEMQKGGFGARARIPKFSDQIGRKDFEDLSQDEIEKMSIDELAKPTRSEVTGLTPEEYEQFKTSKQDLFIGKQKAAAEKEKSKLEKITPNYLDEDPVGYYQAIHRETMMSGMMTEQFQWNRENLKPVRALIKSRGDLTSAMKKQAAREELTEKEQAALVLTNDPKIFDVELTGLFGGNTKYLGFKGYDGMSEDEIMENYKNMSGAYKKDNTGKDRSKEEIERLQEDGLTKMFESYVRQYDYMTIKYGDSLLHMSPREKFVSMMKESSDFVTAMDMFAIEEPFKQLIEAQRIKVDKGVADRFFKQVSFFDRMYSQMARLEQCTKVKPEVEPDKEVAEKDLMLSPFFNAEYAKSVAESEELAKEIFEDGGYERKDKIDYDVKVRSMEEIQKSAQDAQKLKKSKDADEMLTDEEAKVYEAKINAALTKVGYFRAQELKKKFADKRHNIVEYYKELGVNSKDGEKLNDTMEGAVRNKESEKNMRAYLRADKGRNLLKGTPTCFGIRLRNFFRGAEMKYHNFKGFAHMSENEQIEMYEKLARAYGEEEDVEKKDQYQREGLKQLVEGHISHYNQITKKYGKVLSNISNEELFQIRGEISPDLSNVTDIVTMKEDFKELIDNNIVQGIEPEVMEKLYRQMDYFSAVKYRINNLDMQLQSGMINDIKQLNNAENEKNEDGRETLKVCEEALFGKEDLDRRLEKMQKSIIEEEKRAILNKDLDKDVGTYKELKTKEKELGGADHAANSGAMDYRAAILKLKTAAYESRSKEIDTKTKEIAAKFLDKRKEQVWEELVKKAGQRQANKSKEEKLQIGDRLYAELAEKQTNATLAEKIALYNAEVKEIKNKHYKEDKEKKKLNELKVKTMEGIRGYGQYSEKLTVDSEEARTLFKSEIKRTVVNSELNVINIDLKTAAAKTDLKVDYYNAQKQLEEKAKEESHLKDNYTKEELEAAKETYAINEITKQADRLNPVDGVLEVQKNICIKSVEDWENWDITAGIGFITAAVSTMLSHTQVEELATDIEMAKFLLKKCGELKEAITQKRFGTSLRQLPPQIEEKIQRVFDKEKNITQKLNIESLVVTDKAINSSDKIEQSVQTKKMEIFENMNKIKQFKESKSKAFPKGSSGSLIQLYRDKTLSRAAADDYNDNIEKNIRAFTTATEGADIQEAMERQKMEKQCTPAEEKLIALQTNKQLAGIKLSRPLFGDGANTFKNFKGFSNMSVESLTEMFRNMKGTSKEEISAWVKPFSEALIVQYDYMTRTYGKGLLNLKESDFFAVYGEFQKDAQSCEASHNILKFIEQYSKDPNNGITGLENFGVAKKQANYFSELKILAEEKLEQLCNQRPTVKNEWKQTEFKELENSVYEGNVYKGETILNLKAKPKSLAEIKANRREVNKQNITLIGKNVIAKPTISRKDKMEELEAYELKGKELQMAKAGVNRIFDAYDARQHIINVMEQKLPKIKRKNPEIFSALLCNAGGEETYQLGYGDANMDVLSAHSKAMRGITKGDIQSKKGRSLNEDERIAKNLGENQIAKTKIKDNMFRGDCTELAFCAGARGMSEESLKTMLENMGTEIQIEPGEEWRSVESIERKNLQTLADNRTKYINKKGLRVFAEVMKKQADFLMRKYGTNIAKLSPVNLAIIYPDVLRDFNNLNLMASLMEHKELFPDEDEKEFALLKKQINYFEKTMQEAYVQVGTLRGVVQVNIEEGDVTLTIDGKDYAPNSNEAMEALSYISSMEKGEAIFRPEEYAKLESEIFDGEMYDPEAPINANVEVRSVSEILAEREKIETQKIKAQKDLKW